MASGVSAITFADVRNATGLWVTGSTDLIAFNLRGSGYRLQIGALIRSGWLMVVSRTEATRNKTRDKIEPAESKSDTLLMRRRENKLPKHQSSNLKFRRRWQLALVKFARGMCLRAGGKKSTTSRDIRRNERHDINYELISFDTFAAYIRLDVFMCALGFSSRNKESKKFPLGVSIGTLFMFGSRCARESLPKL